MLSLSEKIEEEAKRNAAQYSEILKALQERFSETPEQVLERVEIIGELCRERPESTGAAAEFLGLTGGEINLVLDVLGVTKPVWIEDLIAEEVRLFDLAGEAIRSAIIAVSNSKGYNIAAARQAINEGLEAVAEGGKTLGEVASELGVTEAELIAYRDA